MIKEGDGKYQITLNHYNIGDDLLITVTGGKEHIGAISLMDNNKYSSLSKISHKDEIISKFVVNSISTLINKDILVVCGIHIDNATKEDISTLILNTNNCVTEFLMLYKE